MSAVVSITDEVKVAELLDLAQRGLALLPEDLAFLSEYLDHRESDILEALRPGRRPWTT
jgi:hypothetical protein